MDQEHGKELIRFTVSVSVDRNEGYVASVVDKDKPPARASGDTLSEAVRNLGKSVGMLINIHPTPWMFEKKGINVCDLL